MRTRAARDTTTCVTYRAVIGERIERAAADERVQCLSQWRLSVPVTRRKISNRRKPNMSLT